MPPFTEMRILILGKVAQKSKLEEKVAALGGKIATVLDETVHLLLAEPAHFQTLVDEAKKDESSKKAARMLKAESLNITVVNVAIVDECAKTEPKLGERRLDVAAFITKHKISSFGEFKAPGKRKRRVRLSVYLL